MKAGRPAAKLRVPDRIETRKPTTLTITLSLPVNIDAELAALRHFYFLAAWRQTGGNLAQCAKLLGVSYKTVFNWIRDFEERAWQIAQAEGLVDAPEVAA